LTAKEGLLKAAGIVAVLSVISKFLGFAREASLAAVFGATYATDAYFMGQTIPVVIFSAVSAALGSTFIPVFSQVRQVHGRDAAYKMVSSVINATVLLAVGLHRDRRVLCRPANPPCSPGIPRRSVCAYSLHDKDHVSHGSVSGLIRASDRYAPS
jgi:hypothetical protein